MELSLLASVIGLIIPPLSNILSAKSASSPVPALKDTSSSGGDVITTQTEATSTELEVNKNYCVPVWIENFRALIRPLITIIALLALVVVPLCTSNPAIFSDTTMSLLTLIVGSWFGSRIIKK